MYFQSRAEAGAMLATNLANYRYENTVVVALNDGAVQVGMQIAAELHATLTMLLTETIEVPGEGQVFGALNQDGEFVFNSAFSEGQIQGYYMEFYGYLEDQKRVKMSAMNRVLGSGGIVNEDMLREQIVVLLSDGFKNSTTLDAAVEFLKPLSIRRLIIAAPVASVEAVDRAHILSDEVHFLGVTDNYLDTNHYYDVNDVPDHEQTMVMLNDFVLRWR